MRTDRFTTLGGSLVHHGPLSRRAYVVRLAPEDAGAMPGRLEALAAEHGYTKLLAKAPAEQAGPFLDAGFRVEAELPFFFRGRTHGQYLARYRDRSRSLPRRGADVGRVLELARTKALEPAPCTGPAAAVEPLGESDAPALAALFASCFSSYPFPVHDPDYLRATMRGHSRYYGVRDGAGLAAAASAEVDRDAQAAEATDFATAAARRGRGLAGTLLRALEDDLLGRGVRTLFSLARAASPGMNAALARAGYAYTGTLTNNTHFNGALESMNCWIKHAALPAGGRA
jgi:putative beta-lysine N-acetyltransferase